MKGASVSGAAALDAGATTHHNSYHRCRCGEHEHDRYGPDTSGASASAACAGASDAGAAGKPTADTDAVGRWGGGYWDWILVLAWVAEAGWMRLVLNQFFFACLFDKIH